MQIVYTLKILCLCVFVFNLTGCTKADMMYPIVEATQGLVVICPDQSEYTLPALQYYFYNIDTSQEYIVRACDGSGNFKGTLPIGTYRVIATNTSASGVTFGDMHNYELAAVYANGISATRSQQSDKVYSAVMNDLTVSQFDTLHYKPVSTLLTRTVTLTFALDEKLSAWVSGLNGLLYGVYPSVHLFTGQTREDEIRKCPDTYFSYSATVSAPQTWTATMQIFGLYNPGYGEAYNNIMPITLNMRGTYIPVNIDLTHSLTDIISSFDGGIPVDIPLEIDIELEWDGVEVIGTIRPWQNGGTGDGEIN